MPLLLDLGVMAGRPKRAGAKRDYAALAGEGEVEVEAAAPAPTRPKAKAKPPPALPPALPPAPPPAPPRDVYDARVDELLAPAPAEERNNRKTTMFSFVLRERDLAPFNYIVKKGPGGHDQFKYRTVDAQAAALTRHGSSAGLAAALRKKGKSWGFRPLRRR